MRAEIMKERAMRALIRKKQMEQMMGKTDSDSEDEEDSKSRKGKGKGKTTNVSIVVIECHTNLT